MSDDKQDNGEKWDVEFNDSGDEFYFHTYFAIGTADEIGADSAIIIDGENGSDEQRKKAYLVKAAPDLLAALKLVEWRGARGFNGDGSRVVACPACHGVNPDDPFSYVFCEDSRGHQDGCGLAAAIAAAEAGGCVVKIVITKAERATVQIDDMTDENLDTIEQTAAEMIATITQLKADKADLLNEVELCHAMLTAVYDVMDSGGGGVLQWINKADNLIAKHAEEGGAG